MKLVLPTQFAKVRVYAGYLGLPLCMLYCFGVPGAIAGIIAAYFCDFLTPRFMAGVSWNAFRRGLDSVLLHGVLGTRICIKLPSRRLYLYRGEYSGETVYALQFHRFDWDGLIGEREESYILKRWGSAIMPDCRWRLRTYAYIILSARDTTQADTAAAVTQYMLDRTHTEFSDVLLYVDVAHIDMHTIFGQGDSSLPEQTSANCAARSE